MGLRNLKAGKLFSPELHEQMLNIGLKQSNRLNSLVDALLDITHIKHGKFKFQYGDADITEIIRSVSNEMSALKTDLELPLTLMARVDSRRVEQVLLNLYNNSSKYAPGSDIKIKATADDKFFKITYQDFGPGIDPSMHSRVFQRFERSSYNQHISGLGLGLYIVKKIVEGHNGNISLTSRAGEGVLFEIVMPI
jgi:signal transduction histidine kinase